MSVAEIKKQAKQQAQRGSWGVSALSLIRSAKGQNTLAQERERAGDLKAALSALTKAATFIHVVMESAEFKARSVPGKRGLLWKEFSDFQQREGSDLLQRAHAIESKLTQAATPTRAISSSASASYPTFDELKEIDSRRSASNVKASNVVISSDKDEKPLLVPERGSRKPIRLRAEGETLQISDKTPVKVEEPELETLRRRYHELEQERNMLRDDNKHLSATMNQLKVTMERNTLCISAIDDAISCDVCADKMWSPYVLSNCGHTFCQGCLTKWFNTILARHRDIGARGMARYTCPTCRLPARTPPVQNISLKRIVRLVAEFRGESGPRSPQAPPSPPPHRDSSPGPFGVFFCR